MIQSIPATNNLLIQIADRKWWLSNGQNENGTPLVEANALGLSYQPTFARARNLPEAADLIPGRDIDMVIVGWEDGNWHLGLLFTPDFASQRGGRWCGLARIPAPVAETKAETAKAAGQALADALAKPFRFVAVQPLSEPAPEPVRAAAPVPETDGLPAAPEVMTEPTSEEAQRPRLPNVIEAPLPITVSEWALAPDRAGLSWQRSRGWRIETTGRVIFFGALTLLFFLLSLGELRSNYAPVQPEWLPIVGIVVAVIMAFNALYHLGTLLMTSSVQFDLRSRMIRIVRRPMGVTKQVPFEKVEYLLVSNAISRRELIQNVPSETAIERIIAEVWLHIVRAKGDFLEIGHIGQTEGRAVRASVPQRHPLDLSEFDTPAHQAAIQLARAMEVPIMVEDRGGPARR